MVLSVIAATLIVFSLSRLQGDPRYLFLASGYTTQEQWDAWGEEFGLDQPLPIQYFIWLGKAMTGDFGKSLKSGYTSTTMLQIFAPASIQLGLAAWVFVLITGVPLGVLSAVKRGSPWDLVGRTFAVFGQALPPFWLGIMLILLFSVQLDWLPSGTRGSGDEDIITRLSYFVLPAVTLGWLASAGLMRLVRSSMLEVLDSEFVKLARAKGGQRRGKHHPDMEARAQECPHTAAHIRGAHNGKLHRRNGSNRNRIRLARTWLDDRAIHHQQRLPRDDHRSDGIHHPLCARGLSG